MSCVSCTLLWVTRSTWRHNDRPPLLSMHCSWNTRQVCHNILLNCLSDARLQIHRKTNCSVMQIWILKLYLRFLGQWNSQFLPAKSILIVWWFLGGKGCVDDGNKVIFSFFTDESIILWAGGRLSLRSLDYTGTVPGDGEIQNIPENGPLPVNSPGHLCFCGDSALEVSCVTNLLDITIKSIPLYLPSYAMSHASASLYFHSPIFIYL